MSDDNTHGAAEPSLASAGSAANRQAILDGWIPVTERLPEERIAVAVFVQGDNPADRSVTVAHMFQGHWRCPYFGEEFLEDVSIVMGRATHWMPLPQPPAWPG
jgi:hypothetical protein